MLQCMSELQKFLSISWISKLNKNFTLKHMLTMNENCSVKTSKYLWYMHFCQYGTMIKLKQMFDLRFTCIHGSAVREVGWWGGGGADRLTKNPDKLNKNHYISNHQNHIINILFFHIILNTCSQKVFACVSEASTIFYK